LTTLGCASLRATSSLAAGREGGRSGLTSLGCASLRATSSLAAGREGGLASGALSRP